jgi:hypothetical protein
MEDGKNEEVDDEAAWGGDGSRSGTKDNSIALAKAASSLYESVSGSGKLNDGPASLYRDSICDGYGAEAGSTDGAWDDEAATKEEDGIDVVATAR